MEQASDFYSTIEKEFGSPVGTMAAVQSTTATTDFDLLVGSFDRWKKDIARKSTDLGICHPLLTYENLDKFARRHNLPPVPKIIQILASMPVIRKKNLKENEKECSICREPFRDSTKSSSTHAPDEVDEKPVRLPCGHIFGDVCFRDWIWPFGQGTNCPMCRSNDFPNHQQFTGLQGALDVDGYELRLDEIVWTDYEGGKPISEMDRALIRRDRWRIARYRVDEASMELAQTCPLKSIWKETKKWRERGAEIYRMEEELMKGVSKYDQDGLLYGVGENEWRP